MTSTAALILLLRLLSCDPATYDRDEWGAWAFTGERGENGCRWGSRHVALRDIASKVPDLTVIRDEPGRACRVMALRFIDPYTGKVFTGPANKVDVDHVVSLAEAHREGGCRWTGDRKRVFFNDPLNHVPTMEGVNGSKSDRDPGGQRQRGKRLPWLPDDPAARCWYCDLWVQVKARWWLTIDPDEAEALEDVLSACQSKSTVTRRWLERRAGERSR